MPAPAPAYIQHVEALRPGTFGDGFVWLRKSSPSDPEAAWAACPRGEWLLWLAGRCADADPGDLTRVPLVLAACACAEAVLHLVPEGEDRPRLAVEAARRWTRGEATVEEVRAAAATLAPVTALSGPCSATAAGDAASAAEAARKAVHATLGGFRAANAARTAVYTARTAAAATLAALAAKQAALVVVVRQGDLLARVCCSCAESAFSAACADPVYPVGSVNLADPVYTRDLVCAVDPVYFADFVRVYLPAPPALPNPK